MNNAIKTSFAVAFLAFLAGYAAVAFVMLQPDMLTWPQEDRALLLLFSVLVGVGASTYPGDAA